MTTIKLKNGSGAPLAGDLVAGEPALDLTNKRLYTEDSGGTVIEVGTNPGTDVTFADNRKAIFGAGSDLQIYHDGSNSFIADVGTGNLGIRAENLFLQNADGSENYATATLNGAFTLSHDNSQKLATTATGIDVTGRATVSSGAFDVGGLQHSYGSNDNSRSWWLKTDTHGFGDFALRQSTTKTGSTYETKLLIDASGNVAIGTTSTTAGTFTVDGTVVSQSAVQGSGNIQLQGYGATSYINHSGTGPLIFRMGGSFTERARIDSSGNLLVGTTDPAIYASTSASGINLLSVGNISVSRSSNPAMDLNRISADGDIAVFRKDGSIVGSIGSVGGFTFIGSGDTGVLFDATEDAIKPRNTSTASRDAAIDLGGSGDRFKDLYLSGGAYLGGTGSANKLDDYEQGSWTPTADFANTSPTSGASTGVGRYTKVGNVVTVWGTVSNFNVTGAAGDLNITGLPFAARLATNLQRYSGAVRITNCDFSLFASPIQVNSQVLDNTSVVAVVVIRDDAGSDAVGALALTDGTSDINFTLTYETDA